MEKIKVIIDGCEVLCDDGKSILNVARANNIFIPAICYLSCCSPTLACKMCMVEADGKRVYACNAKVKDGMNVVVHTEEIELERKAIMQAYDVNHPLQCGVCDKSGECELQNYTHYVGVNTQEYALKDDYKEFNSWGATVYDPNLCIVCERCVTVCKDKIGKSYIKTIKRDGDMPSKEYKDTMPKDAFGVWTKFKKSLIGPSGLGDCGDCGECSSVCPVGALSIAHFQYTSNAWELKKIPSSCTHCANGCAITYEVKQSKIGGKEKKVYRVSSDWNFSTLCPAGRLAFETNNQNVQKNVVAFNATIAAFKEAQSIRFLGNISNEEAMILQSLKEKHGYKLVCDEVWDFKEFIHNFSLVCGNFGSATEEDIVSSSFVMCFGGAMSYDMPVITHSINNALKQNKGAMLAYFHTMSDCVANSFVKATNLIEGIYKPQSEEAFVLLLASVLIPQDKWIDSLKAEIAKYEITIKKETEKEVVNKIKVPILDENGKEVLDESGEVKFEEKDEVVKHKEIIDVKSSKLLEYCSDSMLEAFEVLKVSMQKAKNPVLVVGFDVYGTKNSSNIAKILGLIEEYSEVKIMLLPPTTNAIGISLLCSLDRTSEGYSIGYNTTGSYTIGTHSANLLMPYLNEQEGTFVNVNKRVVPFSPATPYYGYELNDIAKMLGTNLEHTIDYTQILPTYKGFKEIMYDDLKYGFLNNGKEIRGYLLELCISKSDIEIDSVTLEPLEEFNLYVRNPVAHFSKQTLRSSLIKSKNGLQLSATLATKLNLAQDDRVVVSFMDSSSIETKVIIDNGMEGEYVALGNCEFDMYSIIGNFRYAKVDIKVAK
ncbi:NADH-quinone oxidoreductase subunit G [Helicobacter ibis]|uniref:NADH-quinone oxidoreductase subunit G n=1 Tax=Helicobacter ibis TaxID=2962633 RepID=A0ABT4VCV8_9HELI|nr:NADH-quinone oxidoreductase subunit G [Helicobacter ibis]MDA3968529.1 NADH-quinone oxidoreductase subunit G [Helicobacter ibis]